MCQAARCGCGVAVMMPGLILVSQGGVAFTAREQNKANPWGEQRIVRSKRTPKNNNNKKKNPCIYSRRKLIEMTGI